MVNGWQIVVFTAVLTVIVVLFMGPGLWSSTTDPLVSRLWRWLRGAGKRRPPPGR